MRHHLIAQFGGQFPCEAVEQRLGRLLPHTVGRQPVGEAADLDEGERIGHQPPAGERHCVHQREQLAAELAGQVRRLLPLLADDGRMPQREMDAAPQLDLELDRIRLGGADRLELALEAGIPATLAMVSSVSAFAALCVVALVRRKAVRFALAGTAASLMVGIHALVDFSLQMPAVAVTYAALLGVCAAQCLRRLKESAN